MADRFDSPIELHIWSTLDLARRRALAEAVNTCGVVAVVFSFEVSPDGFGLVGQVPVAAIEGPPGSPGGRPRVRAKEGGRLHSTFEAIARQEGCVGYYVLRLPLRLVGGVPSAVRGQAWVQVGIDTRRRATQGYRLGQPCCQGCNMPIPSGRVIAVPEVRFCADCQSNREKGEGHDRG